MSKGEREITSKLNSAKGGRENTSNRKEERNHIKPQMLGIQRGEKSHVFRGEKTCSCLLIWFALVLFALMFCSLTSPSIPYKIQGGVRHLREENL